MTLDAYLQRAGLRSRRELSERTGIAHSTLDAIAKHPARARGYQLRDIAEACGITGTELLELIGRRERDGKTKKTAGT